MVPLLSAIDSLASLLWGASEYKISGVKWAILRPGPGVLAHGFSENFTRSKFEREILHY
jgi:hypothetical protein